jgi:hypothetical protein
MAKHLGGTILRWLNVCTFRDILLIMGISPAPADLAHYDCRALNDEGDRELWVFSGIAAT